jgi:transposase
MGAHPNSSSTSVEGFIAPARHRRAHYGSRWKSSRRRDAQKGFEVLPRRWAVEQTFGWMIRWRKLVRDYERRINVSTAMIHLAIGAASSSA